MKTCKTCKVSKPFSEFNRAAKAGAVKDNSNFYSHNCKCCISKRKAAMTYNSVNDTHKQCTCCFEIKGIEEFWNSCNNCTTCIKDKQTEEFREHKRQETKRYVAENKEWKKRTMREYMKEQSAGLTDIYVKLCITNNMLYNGVPFSYKDIPQELIEAKRIQLQQKRYSKELSK